MTTGHDDATTPAQVHVSELLAAHGRSVVPSGRRRRRAEPDDVPEVEPVTAEPAVPVVAEPVAVEQEHEHVVAEVLEPEPVVPAPEEHAAVPVVAEPVAVEHVVAEVPGPRPLLDLPVPAAVEEEPDRPDARTAQPDLTPDPVPTGPPDFPREDDDAPAPVPTGPPDFPREDDDAPAPFPTGPPAVLAEEVDDRTATAPASPAREWALIGAQLVGALVAGGALWFAFRALWEWQSVVAFVLSAVVIVGLVVVVRVLRRAEDTFSTMLAVLAGLIVTVSPPVLTLTGS